MNPGQKFTTHGPGKELFTTIVNLEPARATWLEFEGSGGSSRHPRATGDTVIGPYLGPDCAPLACGCDTDDAGNHGSGREVGTYERRGAFGAGVDAERQAQLAFNTPRWTQRALESTSGADDFEFDDRTFRRRMIWSAVVAGQFLAAAAYAYFWLKNRGY